MYLLTPYFFIFLTSTSFLFSQNQTVGVFQYNESVYDACEDIVNYAILAKAILTEERKELDKENEEIVLAD